MSKDSFQEINILNLLIVLAKYKFFIIKLVFSITLLSLIISLIVPVTYKSTSTIVPVPERRGIPGLAGLMDASFSMPMSLPHVNPEVLINILNSRELRETIIHEFNFQKIYKSDLMEELLMKLDRNIEIVENREGGFGFNPIYSIRLSFFGEDPELCYEVTNFMIEKLNKKTREINFENTIEQLQLLENRYIRSSEELKAAEDSLLAFQEKYGIVQIEEQGKQLVQKLSQIKTRSIETEMQMEVLRQTLSEDHAEIRNLTRIKRVYDQQYEALMKKSEGESHIHFGHYPLLNLPELAIQYFRLYRDVEIQSRVLKSIYPQYESQRMVIEEDLRGVQVIDPAFIPTYKDSPKRAYIVLGGMVFSIFLSLMIVFFRHALLNMKEVNPERYKQVLQLRDELLYLRKKESPSQG